MIDIEKAKKEFDLFVEKYDFNQFVIEAKYNHSYRVMENARNIALSLNLDEEQVELATLIGLLHDIARFDQYTQYKTFRDKDSFDHGDVGAKILEENDYIRKYIETDKYDNVIKTAISNHNKFKIDESIQDELTLLHCKIIRDADKLDIFKEATTDFWRTEQEIKDVENSYITDNYYDQVKERKQILRDEKPTKLGSVIQVVSFAFDLYFDYSKQVVADNYYIEEILGKFNYKDEVTKERIDKIKEILKDFLRNKQ